MFDSDCIFYSTNKIPDSSTCFFSSNPGSEKPSFIMN